MSPEYILTYDTDALNKLMQAGFISKEAVVRTPLPLLPFQWNHKFKRRWVAALRGGNWRQCFGAWNRHGAVCAGQLGIIVAQQMYMETGENRSAYEMMPHGFMDQVIHRNDELQWNFKMIADFIEAEE